MRRLTLLGMLALLWVSIPAFGQWSDFYIGMYTYDFDSARGHIPINSSCFGNDLEYLRGISDYNFNLVLPTRHLIQPLSKVRCVNGAGGPPSTQFLDNAQQLGMKVLLGTPEVAGYCGGTLSGDIATAVPYYNAHSAIIGYGIGDEIYYNSIPSYAAKSGYVRDADNSNSKVRFVNLLGMWLPETAYGGTGSNPFPTYQQYDAYLDSYLTQVYNANPSNPSYPELMTFTAFYLADRPDPGPSRCAPANFYLPSKYFVSMDRMARKSTQYGVPFGLANQLMKQPWVLDSSVCQKPTDRYYGIDEPEYFNFKMFTSLAYGAKGMLYWAREGAFGTSSSSVANSVWDNDVSFYHSGCPRPVYPTTNSIAISQGTKNFIKDLHGLVLDNKDLLMQLKFESVYHYSDASTHPDRSGYLDDIGPLADWSNFSSDTWASTYFDATTPFQAQTGSSLDPLMVSFMTNGCGNGAGNDAGTDYFWLVNKHLSNDLDLTANFKKNVLVRDVFNNEYCAGTQSMTVHLEPGEGKLFQIRGMKLSSTDYYYCGFDWDPSPNAQHYFGEKLAEQFFFGPACSNVISAGAEIGFWASDHYINEEMTIEAGAEAFFATSDLSSGCSFQKSKEVHPGRLAGTFSTMQNSVQEQGLQGLRVYPNPSEGQFEILLDEGLQMESLAVHDLRGQEVFRSDQKLSRLDLSQQPKGIYFLQVKAAGKLFNKKLVLQ